jgi:hypothetical protein
VEGDEDLALWTKGKKKTGRGGRQGPKFGAPPQGGESSSGMKRDMSTVRCFACGEMGHYVGQCPKKKKKQHDISTATIEELEFDEQFARECAFVTTLSVVTPSNIRWGDRVEEDRLTHSSDSEGDQTQFPWTPSSEGVISPPRIASVSELPSRQRLGATALEHQRLMRRSGRAPRGLSLTWLQRRADQVLDPLQVEDTWREAKLMILVRCRDPGTLGEIPRGGDSW